MQNATLSCKHAELCGSKTNKLVGNKHIMKGLNEWLKYAGTVWFQNDMRQQKVTS